MTARTDGGAAHQRPHTATYDDVCHHCGCLDCWCDDWDYEAADGQPPPPGRTVRDVPTGGVL